MTEILYYWFLLLDQFRFCETHFTTYEWFVAGQSAISPFLGGEGLEKLLWPGQFLESYVVTRVLSVTIHLVHRLKGILHQKKVRKKVSCL